ncbi:hypothetical protein MVLG_03205 [Microbotryum lychnidis-dioicae p1A1 Lamole]|uniref:Rho family, other n=2 Tax=Microbotryum TaxID=34416 RepID=U5H7H4_USTV1|nr:hypothetical protein MVLG_03205 [Microbotryum lychnidis-dioicae p1A1 Lamole]SGY75142.1 BQ5605_C005g03403 [Microbotryum silenes-dioicae]|eukprot:KDE06558.1 hypothetical protein MVLG_03205 [Microbotryum lychnidis-dioicae p1A1 Lamole]
MAHARTERYLADGSHYGASQAHSPNALSSASTNSPQISYYTSTLTSDYSHVVAPSMASTPQLVSRPDIKTKLVCVGDGGVGKTCLLMVYSGHPFPTDYCPTVFENYVTNVPFGDKVVEFALWDTAGQEEYDRLRPLSYPESHVIFICFSCDYPPSLENVEDKWAPEVSHFCEGVPIILIATKMDLRSDQHARDLLAAQGRHPVTTEEGQAVARRIGASYAEVSAMHRRGVDEVFQLALDLAIKGTSRIGHGGAAHEGPRRKIRSKLNCTIL